MRFEVDEVAVNLYCVKIEIAEMEQKLAAMMIFKQFVWNFMVNLRVSFLYDVCVFVCVCVCVCVCACMNVCVCVCVCGKSRKNYGSL